MYLLLILLYFWIITLSIFLLMWLNTLLWILVFL